MAFSPPEYCRLFAQKKAYQRGEGGGGGGHGHRDLLVILAVIVSKM